MGYEISYTSIDDKSKSTIADIQHKLTAIESLLIELSEERANQEAVWRKKENYLKTEQGKLQIELRTLVKGTLTEIEGV